MSLATKSIITASPVLARILSNQPGRKALQSTTRFLTHKSPGKPDISDAFKSITTEETQNGTPQPENVSMGSRHRTNATPLFHETAAAGTIPSKVALTPPDSEIGATRTPNPSAWPASTKRVVGFSTGLLTTSSFITGDPASVFLGATIAGIITIGFGPFIAPLNRAINSTEKVNGTELIKELFRKSQDSSSLMPEYTKLCNLLSIPEDQRELVKIKIKELAVSRAGLYGIQAPLIKALIGLGLSQIEATAVSSAGISLLEQFVLVRADAKLAMATLGPEKTLMNRLTAYIEAQEDPTNIAEIIKSRHEEFHALYALSKKEDVSMSIFMHREPFLNGLKDLLYEKGLNDTAVDSRIEEFRKVLTTLPEPEPGLKKLYSELKEQLRGLPFSWARDFTLLFAAGLALNSSTPMLEKDATYLALVSLTTVFNNAMVGARQKGDEFKYVDHFTKLSSFTNNLALRLGLTGVPLLTIFTIRTEAMNQLAQIRKGTDMQENLAQMRDWINNNISLRHSETQTSEVLSQGGDVAGTVGASPELSHPAEKIASVFSDNAQLIDPQTLDLSLKFMENLFYTLGGY